MFKLFYSKCRSLGTVTTFFDLAPFYLLGGGAFTCIAMKNITTTKAAVAARPAVNAYFDLHFVEIRSI